MTLEKNKESFGGKLKGLLEVKSLAIIGLVIMQAWGFVSETFKEGAESKFNTKVVTVMATDHRIEKWINNKFDSLINSAIQNPVIWYNALSTNFAGEFADKKAAEVYTEVEVKLRRADSIQKSLIKQLGEGWGIRDDKVVDVFIELGKKFISGKLGTRVVPAPPF